MNPVAEIWVDGSFDSWMPNAQVPPKLAGGYCFIIDANGKSYMQSGSYMGDSSRETSSHAEMRAVLEAMRFLESLAVPGLRYVHLCTDSQCVLHCTSNPYGQKKNRIVRHEYWSEVLEIAARIGVEIWARCGHDYSEGRIRKCHAGAITAMRHRRDGFTAEPILTVTDMFAKV